MLGKAIVGCLLLSAGAFFMGCPRGGGKDVIQVYVDEAPNDPKNLKKIRIGSVRVAPDGRLTLSAGKTVQPGSAMLEKAVAAIQSRKTLQLMAESMEKIDGKEVLAMKSFPVEPGDPRYLHAVAETLQMEFGLEARVP